MSSANPLASTNPAVAVGDEIQVSTDTGASKSFPTITQLADGGHVVIWQSFGQDGDRGGLFGQRYAADGTPVGAEFQVNESGLLDQRRPSVDATDDGGFIVVWANRGAAGEPTQSILQRFDANADRVGDATVVTEAANPGLTTESVTVLEDGSYMVTWQEFGTLSFKAQLYNADGTPAGDPFVPHADPVGVERESTAVALPGGGFAMLWHSSNSVGPDGGLQIRFFDVVDGPGGIEAVPSTDGLRLNDNLKVPGFGSNITVLSDGRIVVTWSEIAIAGDDDREGVLARVLPADLPALANDPAALQEALSNSPIFLVNTTVVGTQNFPDVLALQDGGFVISWTDRSSGNGDVRLQQFAADGTPVGDEQVVNTITGGDQGVPQLALSDEGFVTAWLSGTNVKLQRFSFESDPGSFVISESGTVVVNNVDLSGDPAVLISGNDNSFTNQAGATLTGTGGDLGQSERDATIEVTGTGNSIVNEQGALIAGISGIIADGIGTSVANSGEIASVNPVDGNTFENTFGVRLGDGGSLENDGLIRADGFDSVSAVWVQDGATVQNSGTIQADSDFQAAGIFVNRAGVITNLGEIDVAADLNAFGIRSFFEDTQIENAGTIRVSGPGGFGNLGISVTSDTTVVNTGEIEVSAGPSGRATGIQAFGNNSIIDNQGNITASGTGTATAIGLDLLSRTAMNSGTITAESANGHAAGVDYVNGGDFTNTGTITATGATAVGLSMELSGLVINDGDIVVTATDGESIGLDFMTASNSSYEIVNTGTIAADIAIRDQVLPPLSQSGVQNVNNSGTISGLIDLGDSNDSIANTGTINGDIDLGDGDDVFDGALGFVNGDILGGLGNDTISGGMTDQSIFGGEGDDLLSGNAGDDILIGGAGADTMDGGDGLDTLDYSASQAGVQVNLGDASSAGVAPIKAGAGTAFGGDAEGDLFSGIEAVIGSEFDDFVYGSGSGDTVALGGGNDVFDNTASISIADVLDMGAGDDTARAGNGDDVIHGGSGNDELRGQRGNDTLFGDEGEDRLFGNGGRDTLNGGGGNDELRGGGGADILRGGAGDDDLFGNGGSDTFIMDLDGGADQIFGFRAGSNSVDVVDLTAFDTITTFDDVLSIATEVGNDTVLALDMTSTLTLVGIDVNQLNSADFILV